MCIRDSVDNPTGTVLPAFQGLARMNELRGSIFARRVDQARSDTGNTTASDVPRPWQMLWQQSSTGIGHTLDPDSLGNVLTDEPIHDAQIQLEQVQLLQASQGATQQDERALRRQQAGQLMATNNLRAQLTQDLETPPDTEAEEELCAICLGSFEVGERVTKLGCGHRYHEECISGYQETLNQQHHAALSYTHLTLPTTPYV